MIVFKDNYNRTLFHHRVFYGDSNSDHIYRYDGLARVIYSLKHRRPIYNYSLLKHHFFIELHFFKKELHEHNVLEDAIADII